MKICTKCGAEVIDNAAVCSQCGGDLNNSPQKSTPQGKPTPKTTSANPTQITQQPQNFQQMMNVNLPRKFCSSCGTEIFNNSVICTSCGCLVGNIQPQRKATNTQYTPNTQNGGKLTSLFEFITGIFALISMFFVIASVMVADVYGFIEYGYSYYGYFHPDEVFLSLGIIASIVTFALSTTTLILSIVKHQKTECIFSSVLKLVFSVLTFLLCVMPFA